MLLRIVIYKVEKNIRKVEMLLSSGMLNLNPDHLLNLEFLLERAYPIAYMLRKIKVKDNTLKINSSRTGMETHNRGRKTLPNSNSPNQIFAE
jgi:hypothetical protein